MPAVAGTFGYIAPGKTILNSRFLIKFDYLKLLDLNVYFVHELQNMLKQLESMRREMLTALE